MAKPKSPAEDIDGPAKLHPGHSKARLLGAQAGAPTGWTNDEESTLDKYASRGLLAGGGGQNTSELRLRTGHAYRRLCERCRGSGKDSTQMVISGANSPGTITDGQAQAIQQKIAVDWHLSPNDRTIVRMVCDEGFWPSEAVRIIDPQYRYAVVPRFREAMDRLVAAFESSNKTRLL